ncbi:MAG: CmpX protein [Candidatus Saganbacteria bacterium]|uniref:CmpX protein n=1 Tax=Candidatus Saganbacteria bacterium TaxID=2575572 RepID=A0A833L160_UNCSA|nr:MAG: CmpX protein [Candidatus Saganbacteria bacterium]
MEFDYMPFYLVFLKISTPFLYFIISAFLLLLGFWAANLIKITIKFILGVLQFDSLMNSLKFNLLLEKAEIKKEPSELLSNFVYWFIIIILILGTASQLKVPVDSAIDRVISYISIVFLAAITLSFGAFIAILISSFVYFVAVNFGLSGAKPVSRIIQYATVIFAFLLALEQLGVGPALLVPSIGVIIGAVGLALAIAFGLGCKDIMADFVSNLIKGK